MGVSDVLLVTRIRNSTTERATGNGQPAHGSASTVRESKSQMCTKFIQRSMASQRLLIGIGFTHVADWKHSIAHPTKKGLMKKIIHTKIKIIDKIAAKF